MERDYNRVCINPSNYGTMRGVITNIKEGKQIARMKDGVEESYKTPTTFKLSVPNRANEPKELIPCKIVYEHLLNRVVEGYEVEVMYHLHPSYSKRGFVLEVVIDHIMIISIPKKLKKDNTPVTEVATAVIDDKKTDMQVSTEVIELPPAKKQVKKSNKTVKASNKNTDNETVNA